MVLRHVQGLTEKHFDASFDEVFARLDADGDGVVDPTNCRLMFGDFFIPGADPKVYGEVLEYDQLHAVVTEYLTDFNSTSKKPMCPCCSCMLEHVCRICRIISQPGGTRCWWAWAGRRQPLAARGVHPGV